MVQRLRDQLVGASFTAVSARKCNQAEILTEVATSGSLKSELMPSFMKIGCTGRWVKNETGKKIAKQCFRHPT